MLAANSPRSPLGAPAPGPEARLRRGLVVVLLLVAPSCVRGEESVTKPIFETRLTLKDASGKETSACRSRETLTLVVTTTNRSDTAQTLTLSSGQTHDFIIHARGAGQAGKGEEVWRWSGGMMFAQVITELTFAPGESRSFTATWDQTGRKGAPVPPGDYQAVGLVPAGAPGLRSDPVTFAIRPPGP